MTIVPPDQTVRGPFVIHRLMPWEECTIRAHSPDADPPPSTPTHTREPRESAEHTPHQPRQQITQIYEGTNQVQRLVMGRKLLA